MQVYLAMDPFNGDRISAQARPFDSTSLPRGPQGVGWPMRHLTVTDNVWESLLAGRVSPDDQDVLHHTWWDAANPG